MARRASGAVVERPGKKGITYAARFTAYGVRRYEPLGYSWLGYSRRNADDDLANILADVRRGTWRPGPDAPPGPAEDPTFHEWASRSLQSRQAGLSERSVEDWKWALSYHLLPAFAELRLTEITKQSVRDYRDAKVRERDEKLVERPLANSSISKTIGRLADLMQEAVDLDLIAVNPARGRWARLPKTTPKRRWLQIEHVIPMIDGAGPSRALMATLLLAGLRIGEALDLRWSAIDLAAGTLSVIKAKSPAGVRTVNLTPLVRHELTAHKLQSSFCQPDDLVFCTSEGLQQNRQNVIKRVTHRAAKAANVVLAERQLALIPEDLTNHDLRRVFSSLLDELNAPQAYKDQQMGHEPDGLEAAYNRAFVRPRDICERMDALVLGDPPDPAKTRTAV